MANEAQIIDNPTSTPEAVSTGYQAQNTRAVAGTNGIDKTVITGGTGSATLEISGPVDYNGTLYSIASAVTLTPGSAGTYYVYLSGTGDNPSPTLTDDSGTFSVSKNARYTSSSERILNWIIYFDGTTCYVMRWNSPSDSTEYDIMNGPYEEWLTANGTWTAPRSQYYVFTVTGKGGDAKSSGTSGAGGAGATGIKRIFVDAGDSWTAVFSTAEGGVLTFTDGVNPITVNNANNNSGGSSSSGTDVTISGASGNYDESSSIKSQGASSIYGGGGRFFYFTSGNGGDATVYGAGGGYYQGSVGSGKQGVIRIQG